MSDGYQMLGKSVLRFGLMAQKYLLWFSSTSNYSNSVASLFHIRDQACVFITKTPRWRKVTQPPPPPQILSRFLSPCAYFRVWPIRGGGRDRKIVTGGGENVFVESSVATWLGNEDGALQGVLVPCTSSLSMSTLPNCRQVLENCLGSGPFMVPLCRWCL